MPCTWSTSSSIWRTVIVGFSDEYGSWKITWIRLRSSRADRSPWPSTLRPSKRMSPEVGFSSWSSRRPKVLLPEPLSPTRPSVSPRWIESETSSTATSGRSSPRRRRRRLPCCGKCLVRPRVSSSGATVCLPELEQSGDVRIRVDVGLEEAARRRQKKRHPGPVAEDGAVAAGDDADRERAFAVAGVVGGVPVGDCDEVAEPQTLEALDSSLQGDRGDRADAAASHAHHLGRQDARDAHRDRAVAQLGRPGPPELGTQAVAGDLRPVHDAHSPAAGADENAVAGNDTREGAVVEVDEHVLRAHEHLVLADDDAVNPCCVPAAHDRTVPDAREEVERFVGGRGGVRDPGPGL